MFSAVKDFLRRHRRKFLFAGVTIGGFTLLCKFAERKLIEWQDEQARKLLEQQKRKQHYERTLETTRVTVLQLLPNIRKSIERELDSDTFIQAIKDQPEKKRELWQELKLIGFGRTVCTVVCTAVAAPVAHVMMMVLAANSLDSTTSSTEEPSSDKHLQKVLSLEVQTKYMSSLQNLIEEQMTGLITKIMEVTRNTLASLPLTGKLTLPQLESILQQITLSITNNRQNSEFPLETASSGTAVLPWSQYLKEPAANTLIPEFNDKLKNMHLLTVDILNTNDFNDVVCTLVQVGLNYILDEMAAFYFNSQFISQKLINETKPDASESNARLSPAKSSISQTDPTDQSKSVWAAATGEAEQNRTSGEMISACDASNNSSSCCNSAEIATCVVVKLVPILSGIVHKALPTARQLPGQLPDSSAAAFYNSLFVCSQLEALAYNVYDTLVLSSPSAQTSPST